MSDDEKASARSVEWWWIRHGPTHAARMVGHTDRPADLSDHAALARLRAVLPTGAAVLSSDLSRARSTARALGLTPVTDPRLRELHYGAWEDLAFDDPAVDPALARAFWDTPGETRPPQGESWYELCDRVAAVMREQTTGPVIAVAHMGVILAALSIATRMPAKSALSFRIEPLSLSRMTWFGGADWSVDAINHRP